MTGQAWPGVSGRAWTSPRGPISRPWLVPRGRGCPSAGSLRKMAQGCLRSLAGGGGGGRCSTLATWRETETLGNLCRMSFCVRSKKSLFLLRLFNCQEPALGNRGGSFSHPPPSQMQQEQEGFRPDVGVPKAQQVAWGRERLCWEFCCWKRALTGTRFWLSRPWH